MKVHVPEPLSSTQRSAAEVCDNDHPHALDDFNSWRDPDPRRRFILSVGFALQRGNSRMLRQADRRRSGTRYRGRRSGVDAARAV